MQNYVLVDVNGFSLSSSLLKKLSTATPRCRSLMYAALLVFAAIFTAPDAVFGQAAAAQVPQRSPQRILVKLQPSLAQQIEAELPVQGSLQAMTVATGQLHAASVNSFLSRYSPNRMTPVYPAIIRARRSHGWTDAQFADHLRQQFRARAARQTQPTATPEISRTYVLEFPGASATQIEALLQRLQADPQVEYAEPDRFVNTNQLPNDHFLSTTGSWGQSYPDLWGHYKINAPTAWNTALGDGIIVAVVDTGIDYNHPDIAANVWINTGEIPNNGIDDDHNGFIDDVRGWDFIGASCGSPTQSNDPIDHFGHGTHVAGTIAAIGNNSIGVIGIAWHAQVMAVKGLDDGGCGLESTLAPAIDYAANNGADVINASWGGGGTSFTIEQAVQFAAGLGVVFVAAAGNSAIDALNFFPANSPEAITVAASDAFNNFAPFSDFGTKIDVTAPGVDVLSLQASGTQLGPLGDPNFPGYIRLAGTSMATPHVAGTAALILSQHPTYSPEQVRQVLRASGTSATGTDWDPNFGYGIVNAQGAVALPDVLAVKISSPAPGTFVNSLVVISGTAQGSAFDHYVLEFGTGATPTVWTQFASGTAQVNAAALGTLDPSTMPDGQYTIRLSAFDTSGNPFRDRVLVTVRFVTFTNPAPAAVPVTAMEFKPGTQITITGVATAPAFQSYNIQWAGGVAPTTGWTSTGITLAGGGTSQVNGGTLATWDTSSISTADFFTLRMQVLDGSLTRIATTLVYFEPSLLSQNWPQTLIQGPDLLSGVTPATDAAGNTRLALSSPIYAGSSVPGEYYSFSADGSSANVTSLTYGSLFSPAAGNIDGTGGDQVAVSEQNDIRVFHTDGTSFTLQAPSNPTSFFYPFTQVLLDNVSGTSQLNVMDFGDTFLTNPLGTAAGLFAWNGDGSLLNSNFPLPVADVNLQTVFTPIFGQRVLVGDLNGDGHKEFIGVAGLSNTTFTLDLFAQDGTPLSWAVPTLTGEPFTIVLADLDHNGKLETLVPILDSTTFQTIVHAFQPDGTERPGWPVTIPGVSFTYLAVGDLDRDGTEEIVVLIDNVGIFAFEPDGTPFAGLPLIGSGSNVGPIALGDIDGDGFPEILFTNTRVLQTSSSSASPAPAGSASLRTDFTARPEGVTVTSSVGTTSAGTLFISPVLTAMRRDGTIARTWQLLGAQGNQPASKTRITVGDFNHDGITDLALTYMTVNGGGASGQDLQGVAMVLTTGTAFNADANDWPMIFQNPQNTSIKRRAITLAVTAPSAGATVSGTVPVTATTTGTVTSLQFKLDGANLGTAITAAPFTFSWDTTQVSSGAHKLAALGIDANGRPVASAPVTVNVVSGISSVALGLTAGTSPSAFGIPLTFTATVAPGTATGAVTFFDGTTAISGAIPLSGATASLTNASLTTGTHSISAKYSGDSNFGQAVSPALSQNILKAGTSTSLTSSNGSVNAGTSVTFTATTGSSTTGTPTGSVQFMDGSAVLGLVALNAQGVAVLTTRALSGGTHSVTAQYGGDNNFNSSGSNTVSQNIMDFTEIASPASATVRAGGSATFTFTVNPLGGFNQTVNFSCSGLPSQAQCMFSPSSLTPNGAAVTTTLTITTTAASAVLQPPRFPTSGPPLYVYLSAGILGVLGLALASGKRNRATPRLVLAMIAFGVMATLVACGGGSSNHNPGTPPGTSQVTVTTSSANGSHTASVTLVVN
ncbi:MAG TPA: S8 family serine peptidase [Candidatus Angelobacter sp.]|nr:S8 family serine peptidase [Candidatus Angelobacter sp.]